MRHIVQAHTHAMAAGPIGKVLPAEHRLGYDGGREEELRDGATDTKAEARKLIENLPENSTCDDLMREICVRQAIESGLADSESGRTSDVEQVRAEFGLKK
jgi:hypothetical protein